MNDVMRKRILRALENLPDEVLFQVMDYIEFVEKKYGTGKEQPNPFQRFAEGVQGAMRAGKLPIDAIKGTMSVMDAAGRVVDGVAEAGKSVMGEIQKAADSVAPAEESSEDSDPQANQVDGEDVKSAG